MAEEATARGTVGLVLQERLADAVRRIGWTAGGLVVLMGEPAAAEAAWDAVLDPLPGEWRRVWRPTGAGDLLAGLRAAVPLEPWTVVRLPDLRAVLMAGDVTLAIEVAATLRGVLRQPTDRPVLVAATMPPDREAWRLLTHAPASGGHDRWAQARALLREALVVAADAAPRPFPGAAVPAAAVPRVAVPTEAVPPADVAPGVAAEAPAPSLVEPSVAAPSLAAPSGAAPSGAAPSDAEPSGEQRPGEVPAALAAGRPLPEAASEPALAPVPAPVPPRAGAGPDAAYAPSPAPEERTDETTAEPAPAEPGAGPDQGPGPDAEHDGDGGQDAAGGQDVAMTGAVIQRPVPRWRPSALPVEEDVRPTPDVARRIAAEREAAGDTESAVRWYERAAQEGDLAALARLAALRGEQPPDAAAEQMFRRAAEERNTAVLFGLAAAGHVGALKLLAELRGEPCPGDPPAPRI